MNLRSAIKAEAIRRLYIDERWTTAQLAAHYHCAEITITRRLKELGIARRPRGPKVDVYRTFDWSPKLAYAVGLIATDGNLSSDGRHLSVVSKDQDLLETLRACLNIGNSITLTTGGAGLYCHRLQWGNRIFYDWLTRLGLTPAKSLRLGPLAIPDQYFADFMRGCIDGDGSIVTYTDRYNTPKSDKYVYERLFVILVSASAPFLEWVQATTLRLTSVEGALFPRHPGHGHSTIWTLKYAKHDSLRLLNWMYYAPDVPCLARKKEKAWPFLKFR